MRASVPVCVCVCVCPHGHECCASCPVFVCCCRCQRKGPGTLPWLLPGLPPKWSLHHTFRQTHFLTWMMSHGGAAGPHKPMLAKAAPSHAPSPQLPELPVRPAWWTAGFRHAWTWTHPLPCQHTTAHNPLCCAGTASLHRQRSLLQLLPPGRGVCPAWFWSIGPPFSLRPGPGPCTHTNFTRSTRTLQVAKPSPGGVAATSLRMSIS